MAKVIRRKSEPGEHFLGGRGILVPMRFRHQEDKTMGGILSERRLGPDEMIFGGKGIVIPFRPKPEVEDPMLPAMNGLEQALRAKAEETLSKPDDDQD